MIWNSLDQSCFKNFSNHFAEQELLLFFITTENVHPKYLNLLQNFTENISELEILPNMVTRAITANRLIDHNNDEQRSNQSMTTEKIYCSKTKTKNGAGFHSQTQTTSVILYPNLNNNETTESISPTGATGNSVRSSSTRSQVLQIHCKFLHKLFQAILIFIIIQIDLKNRHIKSVFWCNFSSISISENCNITSFPIH